MFPESNFDLEYKPVEPTHVDLQFWDYDTAKELHQRWFTLRSIVSQNDEPMVAAYYAYRLRDQYGLDRSRYEIPSGELPWPPYLHIPRLP